MKKLFMILFASAALAACGGGSNQSEASREQDENYETTSPNVSSDEDLRNESSPDTMMIENDTTSTSRQGM